MPLKKHEAEKLIDVIRGFVEPGRSADPPVPAALVSASASPGNGADARKTPAVGTMIVNPNPPFDEEALYQRFRARIIDDAQIDPILLKLLTTQPELIVEYERREVVYDDTSLRGRIAKLIAQGFLDTPRKNSAIDLELGKYGTRPAGNRLSEALADLVTSGFLVRLENGVQKAPGVKITERDLVVKA